MREERVSSTEREPADPASQNAEHLPGQPSDETQSPGSAGSSDRATDAPVVLSAVTHPVDVEEVAVSDEEVAMYRRRIAEGLYNSREVAAEVARRMLQRREI